MKHLLRPALGAVLVLVVAACADPSGQSWTPPPAGSPAAETSAPESAAPESAAPATAAPATAAPASAAPSAPASEAPASVVPGEARVIELELDGALQIKQNGQKVTDIPVTPGETITFKLNNTAGYAHNFWIGTDQELSVPNAKTAAGVPDWNSGPQEFTWVVPDDVSGLKFGCTVPGHYSLMQGTFSVAA
jgi:uncharacterized cupredoxin-like copper-binding protein